MIDLLLIQYFFSGERVVDVYGATSPSAVSGRNNLEVHAHTHTHPVDPAHLSSLDLEGDLAPHPRGMLVTESPSLHLHDHNHNRSSRTKGNFMLLF